MSHRLRKDLPDLGKYVGCPPAQKATGLLLQTMPKQKPSASLTRPSSPIFIEPGSINNSCLPPPSSLTHTALCFYIYLCPRTGQNKMQGPLRSQHPVRGRTRSPVAQQRAQQNTSLRLPALGSSSEQLWLPATSLSPQLSISDSRNALFLLVKKKKDMYLYLYLSLHTHISFDMCAYVMYMHISSISVWQPRE